jgi:DNA-binding NtrC family response regulator
MTRGTIAFIGSGGREIELLQARLEKDGYALVCLPISSTVYNKIRKVQPQAVLVTDRCSKGLVEGIVAATKKFKTKIPVIMVTNDLPLEPFYTFKGLGEVWRLHSITLAESMRRLRFAIQLCQIA